MAEERKLLAEWFWTDRWMGSSGFLLAMEPRGLYREMLTQAWRRGARLPSDHEEIRRAIGCTLAEWRRCWPKVEKFWRLDGDALVNDTQLEVYAEAQGVQQRAHERGVKGAQARAQARAQAKREQPHKDEPPSPSPSPNIPPVRTPEGKSAARVGAGVMAGSLPRDHVNCRQPCIRVCLSEKQHGVLRERHGGTDADLDAFYAEVRSRLDPGTPIGETPWKFWDTQFSARFGAAVVVNPRTAGNAAAAARFVARGRQ